MRLRSAILCVLTCVLIGCSYIARAGAPQYAYRVRFTDKKGSLSLSDSASFLSPRALARRHSRGVTVDSTDIPVSPAYIDSALTLTGGKMHVVSRWLNQCVILLTDSSQVNNLKGKPYVIDYTYLAYYPSGLHKISGGNPKFSTETKAFKNAPAAKKTDNYGSASSQTLFVNGNYLHDAGYRGEGMIITVLDAGFVSVDTHPVFDSLRTAGGLLDVHNFVLNTDDVYGYDNHGTEVLSIMAGNEPGIYVGAAPHASYALYITEDDSSEQPVEMDNLLAGIERADSLGTDVISVSLGYDIFDYSSLSYSDIDGKSTDAAKAANMATKKGILFVSSAGNDGGTSWHYVLTPGDADSTLTVGSVYSDKTTDPETGHGPNAAGQRKPDVCDLGIDVIVANAYTTGLGADAGTSMATPQIAGWATCLWQAKGYLKPAAIRDFIIKSADHYTTPDYNVGWGTPDFQTALMLLGVKDAPNPYGVNWVTAGPNPFTNEIDVQISVSLSQIAYFNLIDIAGRSILKTNRLINGSPGSIVKLQVPQSLPAGIYLLRVAANGQKTTLKLEHH